MKIKVLTFFHNANIGSELQAHAMKEFLHAAGYDDVVFIRRGFRGKIGKGIAFLERKLKTIFLKADIKALASVKKQYSQEHAKISLETKKKISAFSAQNLNAAYCNGAAMQKEKDCIYICGSDQIWSPFIYPLVKENFLATVPKRNKIAYAPSFGVNRLPVSFKQSIEKYIRAFDYIAMREENAAKIVSEICGRQVQTVVDPVFLIPEKHWDEMAAQATDSVDVPYVFCYFLDEPDKKTKESIRKTAGGKKLVYICYKEYFADFENALFLDVDPCAFLSLLKNADIVITDSFHATAFSVIFEKNIKIFSRNQPKELHQDGRIRNLISRLGIPREIDCFDNEEAVIDYGKVKENLKCLSDSAKAFFIEALHALSKSEG